MTGFRPASERLQYASALLAGVTFEKVTPRGYRGGEYTRMQWKHSLSSNRFLTRRKALRDAIKKLNER